MEYINVGTDTIVPEYMCSVVDTERIVKPAGGLWCTNYDHKYPNNCDWINFLLSSVSNFFMKAPADHPFTQQAAIIKLNESTKIFNLSGQEAYELFKSKYGVDGHISYEELSKHFDGVYVDIGNIFGDNGFERERNFRLFAVSTLLLFDLTKIDSYRKVRIDIDPFDEDFDIDPSIDYRMNISENVYSVPKISKAYMDLFYKVLEYYEKRNFQGAIDHNQLVYIIYTEICDLFKRELAEMQEKQKLDSKKVGYSIATKVLTTKTR